MRALWSASLIFLKGTILSGIRSIPDMGKETSERIQTSILNNAERKVLIWLAQRQPKWVTSDVLTYVGVFGSVLIVVGGWLANVCVLWLWLSLFGLFLHWYGDSLDGTLARVRNTQRPIYGFFIDHSLDAITTCLICIGLGASPIVRMDVALFILAGYLSLSIYTYVSTIITGKFLLTYGKMGPTEVRLLFALVMVFYMYTPVGGICVSLPGVLLSLFDVIGIIVAIAIFILFFIQFAADRRRLSRQDPPKRRG